MTSVGGTDTSMTVKLMTIATRSCLSGNMSQVDEIIHDNILCGRILDKMENQYQNIISISDEVSSQVMKRQNDLRQHSLQQMNSASRREHEILGAWRKIVLHNTHPWYVYPLSVMMITDCGIWFSVLCGVTRRRGWCVGSWILLRGLVENVVASCKFLVALMINMCLMKVWRALKKVAIVL